MPAPATFQEPVSAGEIQVAVEPAHNALNSLLLLNKAEHLSGYDEWITRTAAALSPELAHMNRIVMEGLYYAVLPARSWPSFPAYVSFLGSLDPYEVRRQLFRSYDRLECTAGSEAQGEADIETVMASFDNYLSYLLTRFSARALDTRIEHEAYTLLLEPERMLSVIVTHFRTMWERWLAEEWRRKLPLLVASAEAFGREEYLHLAPLEAAAAILGHAPPERWEYHLTKPEINRYIFVPSPHLGPYVGVFSQGATAWFLFGARLPADSTFGVHDLSRSELLVRLNALADDTRLRILRLVRDEGELCSQDILQRLDLSQSATSRHLTQLSATGYLSERRKDGAKCYRLEPGRIEDTLLAISRYLLPKG